MDPKISKLIDALLKAAKALQESTGVPSASNQSTDAATPGYNEDKTKSIAPTVNPLLTSNEEQRWGRIAAIFARTFKKTVDFGYEGPARTGVNPVTMPSAQPTQKDEGVFSKILKFLAPLALLLGGMASAVMSMFAGPGVLGNTGKIITRTLLHLGSKIMSAIIGSVMKWGDNLIDLFTGGKGMGKAMGKIGSIVSALGSIMKKIGPALLKAAKFLPFIGGIVGLYFAYLRFTRGDYFGGAIEIVSAIADFTGAGWMISTALDLFLIARDFTKGEDDKKAKPTVDIIGALKSAGSWVKSKLSPIMRYLPVIGTFINMKEAYDKFVGGDTRGGIESLIQSLVPFIPGIGSKIMAGWDCLSSLFTSSETVDKVAKTTCTAATIFNNIKSWLAKKLSKLPGILMAPLRWMGIIGGEDDDKPFEFPTVDINTKKIVENVKEFSDSFIAGHIEAGSKAIEAIKSAAASAKPYVDKIVAGHKEAWNTIKEHAPKWWDSIVTGHKEAWNVIKTKGPVVWDTIVKGHEEAYKTIADNAPGVWEKIKTVTSSAWDKISTFHTDLWNKAAEDWVVLKEKLSKIWGAAVSMVSSAKDKLSEGGKWALDKIKDMAGKASTSISTAWDVGKAAFINKLPSILSNISIAFTEFYSSLISISKIINSTINDLKPSNNKLNERLDVILSEKDDALRKINQKQLDVMINQLKTLEKISIGIQKLVAREEEQQSVNYFNNGSSRPVQSRGKPYGNETPSTIGNFIGSVLA